MVDQCVRSGDSGGALKVAGASWSADRRVDTVLEIARVLVSNRDPETLVQDLLHALVQSCDKAGAGMVFLRESDQQLVVRAATGYDLAPLRDVALAPGEAIGGKVLQSGQGELYSNTVAFAEGMANTTPANRQSFRRAAGDLGQPRSAVAVPLGLDQEPRGALVLIGLGETESFSSTDLAFFERVADLVSAAMERATETEQLQAAQAVARANRLKEDLVSILAHEMRTPLTSIKGYSTALLMEEAAFSPETQREFLEIIDQECEVLQSLIHDLLESSVIDAGLMKLEPQPVRLPRLAKSLVEDMSRRAQEIRFLLDFPEGFPIIDADPDRIAEVLRNLLDNAVKYSLHGGLVVVRGELREREIVVSVADQGIGIAPEHLNRLFEKFFRVNSGLGRHVVGSGLGLPIARNAVEAHGGRIWAESQLGRGSTFYFTLPLRDPKDASGKEDGAQDG
jgi:signal transduction histidine kinase